MSLASYWKRNSTSKLIVRGIPLHTTSESFDEYDELICPRCKSHGDRIYMMRPTRSDEMRFKCDCGYRWRVRT